MGENGKSNECLDEKASIRSTIGSRFDASETNGPSMSAGYSSGSYCSV